jgi:cell division protein FtsI/penicillin-binding protein 2
MMRDVVTEGTAEGAGFGQGVYGKTGTADVNNASQPNAWFVAFDPSKDIAVANVVLEGGYGATAAAPEVKSVIDAYNG